MSSTLPPPIFCRHSLELLSPTLPKLTIWILLSPPPLSSDPDTPNLKCAPTKLKTYPLNPKISPAELGTSPPSVPERPLAVTLRMSPCTYTVVAPPPLRSPCNVCTLCAPVCFKKKHNACKAFWFTKETVHWSYFCRVDSIGSRIILVMICESKTIHCLKI